MPGTPEDPSVKLARDLYDIRLQDLASAQLGIRKIKEWYDYFPRTDDAHPRIAHHSQHGAFATPEKLAQYVAQDFRNERHAICVVEGITLHWTVSLGVIWNLDPQFFIEHIRELSDDEYRKSLRETRAPNSGAGLRSARVGPWATVRRVVDHGDIRASLEGQQLPSKCKRRVAPTLAGSYCSHTNTSIYNVSNYLQLILVDRLPVYHESFSVDHPKWFKHQKIVRFATIDSPGHIAISQLLTDRDTSTFTAWAYFLDRTDRESLLKGMDAGGIDDFLYKASVMECDYSLIVLAQEVKRFRYQDICYGGMGVNEKLFNVRKVLHRLKTCVDENLAYEEKYQSHPAANNAAGEKILRRDFSRLATRIAHYEESLQWSLNQLMTTMNFRNNVAGFRHMEATSQQTQSMNILSSMASMYVPLTCATGIFGMNLKEINDSPLRLKMFMWVFLGMAMISITFVLVSRQRLRKRRRDASCGEEGESRLEAAAPEEKSTGQVGLIDEKHKGGPFYGRVTRLKSWSFGRFWNRVREARQKDGEV